MARTDPEREREYQRIYQRGWKAAHPEKVIEYGRRSRLNRAAALAAMTPEERDAVAAKRAEIGRRWCEQNPEKHRENGKRWKAKHHEQSRASDAARRKRKKELAAGRPAPAVCEICGRMPTGQGKVLHFDHDHQTGAFRGWICHKCNTALGLADDDPKILLKLVEYLKRSHALREA
jgi:hypothetical protein